MLSGFLNLFRPPVFDDLRKEAQARSLHTILLGTMALTLLFIVYAIFFPSPGQLIIAILTFIVEIVLLVMVRAKQIQLTSWILPSILWAAIVVEMILYGGIRDTGFGAFFAIILIAGLTLGTNGSFIFAALTLVASIVLAIAESQGYLPPYAKVPIVSVLVSHSIVLIAVALLFHLTIRNLTTIIRKITEKGNAEEEANRLLSASQADLEKRISELKHSNTTLQIVAALSKKIYEVKSEEEFLEQSVALLLEQIKLDCVSIYLLDQMEENAILQVSRNRLGDPESRAGNKLNVNRSETSNLLIKFSTLHYKTGAWDYYIDPPKLIPDMLTSQSFALISNDQLYGLLNIQDESSDLGEIETQTLQLVADQIADCIASIRQRFQLQSRVQNINVAERGIPEDSWDQLGIGGKVGYSYDRLRVLAGYEMFSQEVTDQLMAGKSVTFVSSEPSPRARLAAPIILRGNIIGAIGYDNDNVNHEWQEDEKILLETVAARVSLALENTRLVAEAQQRADRERVIGQVTSKIRETLDIETILKTAVKEIRQNLALSEAEVKLRLSEESFSTEVGHE